MTQIIKANVTARQTIDSVIARFFAWRERRRIARQQRTVLMDISGWPDYLIDDIGMTRWDVEHALVMTRDPDSQIDPFALAEKDALRRDREARAPQAVQPGRVIPMTTELGRRSGVGEFWPFSAAYASSLASRRADAEKIDPNRYPIRQPAQFEQPEL
jgi:uncharacterized protein YjiS (DUF1127 family)